MDEIINAIINVFNDQIRKASSVEYLPNIIPFYVFSEIDRYATQYASIGDIYKQAYNNQYYMVTDPNNLDNPSGWEWIHDANIPEDVDTYINFLEYLKTNINQIYRLYEYTKGK